MELWNSGGMGMLHFQEYYCCAAEELLPEVSNDKLKHPTTELTQYGATLI